MTTQLVTYEGLRAKGITLSKSTLLRKERTGEFPTRVQLARRVPAWIESEVDAFIEQKVVARDAGVAANGSAASAEASV
jgi:prophage regulatory protein